MVKSFIEYLTQANRFVYSESALSDLFGEPIEPTKPRTPKKKPVVQSPAQQLGAKPEKYVIPTGKIQPKPPSPKKGKQLPAPADVEDMFSKLDEPETDIPTSEPERDIPEPEADIPEPETPPTAKGKQLPSPSDVDDIFGKVDDDDDEPAAPEPAAPAAAEPEPEEDDDDDDDELDDLDADLGKGEPAAPTEPDEFVSPEEAAGMIRGHWYYPPEDDTFIHAAVKESKGKVSFPRAQRLRYQMLGMKNPDGTFTYTQDIVPEITIGGRGNSKITLHNLPFNRSKLVAQMKKTGYRPEELAASLGYTDAGEAAARRLMNDILHIQKGEKVDKVLDINNPAHKVAGRSAKLDKDKGATVVKVDPEKSAELTSQKDFEERIWKQIQHEAKTIEDAINGPIESVPRQYKALHIARRSMQGEDYPKAYKAVKQELHNKSGVKGYDISNQATFERIIRNAIGRMLTRSARNAMKKSKAPGGKGVGIEGSLTSAGEGGGERVDAQTSKSREAKGEVNPDFDRGSSGVERSAHSRLSKMLDDFTLSQLDPEERARREARLRKLRSLSPKEYEIELAKLKNLPPAEAERQRKILMRAPDVDLEDLDTPEEKMMRHVRIAALSAALKAGDAAQYTNLLKKYGMTGVPRPELKPPEVHHEKPLERPKPLAGRDPGGTETERGYYMPDHRKYSFKQYLELRQHEAMIVGAQSQADAGPSAGGVWGDPAGAAKINRKAHRDAAKKYGNR